MPTNGVHSNFPNIQANIQKLNAGNQNSDRSNVLKNMTQDQLLQMYQNGMLEDLQYGMNDDE